MPWKLFPLLLLTVPAFAAPLEMQNGCGDSPDLKSAADLCAVYSKIEGYYGRYNMITPGTHDKALIANGEPDSCRAYYTSYMQGRNVLCSYRNEARGYVSKATALPLPPGNKPFTKDQVAAITAAGENYKAAKAMHKKYLDLLTSSEADLKKKYQAFAAAVNAIALLGSENDALNNRKRSMFYLLNTEMNCKGGSVSNIPALWWGGANTAHAKLLKEIHPRIWKSVTSAKQIASDAVTHWDGLQVATGKAAAGLDSGVMPIAPVVEHHEPSKEPEIERAKNPLLEIGAGLTVDRGADSLVELIRLAPGPAMILKFFVSLGYVGAVNQWKVTSNDIFTSAVGLVSMPAGLLMIGINKVKERDDAMRGLYTLWAQRALNHDDKLKPQELSKGFCAWYDEQVKKQKQQTVQDALKTALTPGHRVGDPGMPGSAGTSD